ncbi:MAG TPA: selenide, water dikinase SelD [Rhodobacteraceae bacterium]|nr:selenide, water dikinase SelD [Paracoccaceae bacterium]
MHSPLPLTRDIVLIGGGHTHALVLRKWAMKPVAGARLTLINPSPTAPYSGMLPGHIAGHYQRADLEIDLVKLARFAGARLVMAPATGIDRENQRVQVAGQADISYDITSIDIGITTEIPSIAGFTEHALGAKPLPQYTAAWALFLNDTKAGHLPPEVAVIGGGVAGIELALAMMHRLKSEDINTAKVTVLESQNTPLGGIGKGAQQALMHHMQRLGVGLETGVTVAEITASAVHLLNGQKIPAAFTVAAAKPQPHVWLAQTGLANANGYIDVLPTLQSSVDSNIYATGDCAALTFAPRPKAGVFAVRQAPVLYHNLRARLLGHAPKPFRPQKSYLKLISTGGKGAIADKASLKLDGAVLWRWKDRIDRKFMQKFSNYPEMPAESLPKHLAQGVTEILSEAPLCGGCGAKVAPIELAEALKSLPPPQRTDILSRPDDDAAVLAHGDSQQILTTDHLRAFMDDPFRMARITAIHAMGDCWAMGAKPQAALASLILPRMSPKMQAETLREIMAAASETFRAAGAEIVGGHTSQGAELTIGFSLTGLADGPVIRNSGAQIGDALILTKPLGSGTLLAAEMRHLAKGTWMEAAYKIMEQPQDKAAEILAPIAHAMTDVTGFGLAGHLNAMLKTTDIGAQLSLESIPLLKGAAPLAAQGIRSTIWAANRAAVKLTHGNTPTEILLFDPQTAGGLLAAIPASKSESTLTQLKNVGIPAVQIGEITGEKGITLIA